MDYNERLLDSLEGLVDDLRQTNTASVKTNVLLSYPECKKLLWWTYNPFKKFGVTKNGILKFRDSHEMVGDLPEDYSIYDLFRDLCSRKLTGHNALHKCVAFLDKYSAYQDTLLSILDKGLKQGVNVANINAAYFTVLKKNLIPQFSITRAKNFFEYQKKLDFKKDTWLKSRKLDGVRCETFVDGKGDCKTYSREGNEFTTLQVIKNAVKQSKIRNMVLVGEIFLIGEDGNEDFQKVVGDVKKKDYTIPEPHYALYDYVTWDEHNSAKGTRPFLERLSQLEKDLKTMKYPHIFMLEQTKVESMDELMKDFEEANNKGWEGLVIHKNVGYVGIKTNVVLKIKSFSDAEYQILGVETGPFTYYFDSLDNQGKPIKKRKVENMVTNLIIEHKGFRVSVGSGYTIEDRKKWFKNPKLIIGKWATIKYFEETTNKLGNISLRFPTVKTFYDKKRDI